MSESNTTVDNGVNVEALLEARAALTEAPEAAQFKWRATCNWVNGTHSKSAVRSFFGLGEEQQHKSEFTFEADHPEIFAFLVFVLGQHSQQQTQGTRKCPKAIRR